MKDKKPSKKIAYNSKTNIIKCLHCTVNRKVRRNDAIYCTTLCRVQESNYRKENGYSILFKGSTLELKEQFKSALLVTNYCSYILEEALRVKASYDESQSWKHPGEKFIIYYSAKSKKTPWTIYGLAEVRDQIKHFNKMVNAVNSKPNI